MAETILAGKQVKEFSFPYCFPAPAPVFTIRPWFAEHFFMRNRPGNTGDGYSQYKKPNDLCN
jgi:hypothetical protein